MISEHRYKRDKFEVARDLVSTGWIRNVFAADKDGEEVGVRDKGACQWCLIGAIMAATDNPNPFGYFQVFRNANPQCGEWLATWNDKPERTKEEVVQAFDNVIDYLGRYEKLCQQG